jgi:hypothetical protein
MTILIGLLAVAATAGLTTWLRARRLTRLAALRVRRLSDTTGRMSRTVVVAAVVCGLECLVAVDTQDWRALLGVFALPALFAGDSVARLVALVEFARGGAR